MKRKIILPLLLFFSLLLILPVCAADYTLQLSSPTTAVGNEFLLRVTLRDSAWNQAKSGDVAFRLHYDSESLEYQGFSGGLGNTDVQAAGDELIVRDPGFGSSYTLRIRFKALRAGNTSVSITEAALTDFLGKSADVSAGQSVVSILAQGDDASLYSLSVVPGSLSPAFSKDVHHYTISVPSGTPGIQVTARPNGYYATAFVEGHWSLKEGHNLITIDMTSGGGVSSLYTIDVTVGTPRAIPTAVPTVVPTAVPTPLPAPDPSPSPAALPVPSPEPTPIIRDSDETLRALGDARAQAQDAKLEAARYSKIAKIAIAVSIAEFFLIVILGVFLWTNVRDRDIYDEEDFPFDEDMDYSSMEDDFYEDD